MKSLEYVIHSVGRELRLVQAAYLKNVRHHEDAVGVHATQYVSEVRTGLDDDAPFSEVGTPRRTHISQVEPMRHDPNNRNPYVTDLATVGPTGSVVPTPHPQRSVAHRPTKQDGLDSDRPRAAIQIAARLARRA